MVDDADLRELSFWVIFIVGVVALAAFVWQQSCRRDAARPARTPTAANFCVVDNLFRQPSMCADPFPGFELGPELAEEVDGAIRPCDLYAPKIALFHRR